MIFIWSQGRIFDKAVTLRLAIAVEISPSHSLLAPHASVARIRRLEEAVSDLYFPDHRAPELSET
jgi:hypothetical protein